MYTSVKVLLREIFCHQPTGVVSLKFLVLLNVFRTIKNPNQNRSTSSYRITWISQAQNRITLLTMQKVHFMFRVNSIRTMACFGEK